MNSDVLKNTTAFQPTIALPGLLTAILESTESGSNRDEKLSAMPYKDDDLVCARPDDSFALLWNYASAVKDLAQRAGVKLISCTISRIRTSPSWRQMAYLGSRQHPSRPCADWSDGRTVSERLLQPGRGRRGRD